MVGKLQSIVRTLIPSCAQTGIGSYYRPAGGFPDDQWKVSFSLAVALHIVVLLCTLIPSSFFRTRPEMPEVVTINLFNAEELTPTKPVSKKKPVSKAVVPPKTPPPPPVSPKAVSIAKEPVPPKPAPAPPAKVISLKPRIMKKKIVAPEKPDNRALEEKLRNAVERIRAQKKQELAQEKMKDELARLRDQLHVAKTAAPAPAGPQTSSSKMTPEASESDAGSRQGSSEQMDKALSRYYLAVSRKIHEHWVLPEMQTWDDSLEAIFVIVVNSNGVITRRFFEKNSDNSFFNQFVEKTIQAAEPMPHFPSDLKERNLEMGLVFHPSGLF